MCRRVLNDSCVPGTPSAETCNGIDDNCDGIDDNVAPPSGALALNGAQLANGTAHLTWNALATATGYDLVTGSLQLLRSSGGNYSTATTQCLANDLPATSFDAPRIPGRPGLLVPDPRRELRRRRQLRLRRRLADRLP
jgi:hypothetical protein